MLKNPSLVQQVKNHLKQRIIRAEFEDGRIPAEADLARELNVSRNTVRDALSRLEMEGIIIRRQGAGTFVNQAGLMLKTRLHEIIPYEHLIREYGHTPTVQLLNVTEEPASDKLAEALNLQPGAAVLVIDKLFLADETPVILTRTTLSPALIVQPYTPNDLITPIYQFIPRFCRQQFTHYLTELVPALAPPWVIDYLRLQDEETAVLVLEEIGFNPRNEPLVKACSFFRDDFLRLRLIRRPPA